jgi:hypothetical protein
MSNPSSIVELGRAEVSAQNEGLARTLKGARPRLMQAVAEIKSNLSTIADRQSILRSLSWHFCAGCGIFPRTRPHLTNPGTMAGLGAA